MSTSRATLRTVSRAPQDPTLFAASSRLVDLLGHPERVVGLTPADARSLLVPLVALCLSLSLRASSPEPVDAPDHILTLKEIAARLRTSTASLHRKWKRLPFIFKDKIDGKLKANRSAVERYVARRGKG